MVNNHLIDELKVILVEDYGVDLPRQDLSEFANTLVEFFDALILIEHESVSQKTYHLQEANKNGKSKNAS